MSTQNIYHRIHSGSDRIAQWWRGLTPLDRNLFLIVGAGIILFGVIIAVWKVPHWQVGPWKAKLEAKLDEMDKARTDGSVERLKLRNDVRKLESDARTTLVQAFGGLALLIGLLFTWRNVRATERASQETLKISQQTLRNSQEGQITERFTKAINQLGETGAEKLAIRLGGIYALERIARDSERDHWPVMEILTAYVREHVPWPLKGDLPPPAAKPPEGKDQLPPKPAPDIQAILTVLGRRTRIYEEGEDRLLNLAKTDLRGAYLREAHLEGVNLTEAHLEGADLIETRLERAYLRGAHLDGANLSTAYLQEADLTRASLAGATLIAANLAGAVLEGARLERANLEGANLEGAKNLTNEQLDIVKTLYHARLSTDLMGKLTPTGRRLLEEPPAGC